MKILSLFLSCATSLFFTVFALASESYEVIKAEAKVRADSTAASDSLGTLNKGVEVEVVGEKFDWYRVSLPRTFPCYISKTFVESIAENQIQVKAENVNLRSGPSLEFPVIGKASKNQIFPLIEVSGDWLKIENNSCAYGWIHKKFLVKALSEGDLTLLVAKILPQLSEPEIRNKAVLHQKLIDKGKDIVPLLEARLSTLDDFSVYSLIFVLSQLGVKELTNGNRELILHFFQAAQKSALRQASIYLDILENILGPANEKQAYFYQVQNNFLTATDINAALAAFQQLIATN